MHACPPQTPLPAPRRAPCRRLSAVLCEGNVASVLQQYISSAPPLMPWRVHRAAVARAVKALCESAAPGPGAAAATERLAAACAAHWAGGHRQCSALSCSGRPCTCAAHVSGRRGGAG